MRKANANSILSIKLIQTITVPPLFVSLIVPLLSRYA